MDVGNPWYEFAHRVRRGESSKDELIDLLRSGWPMPHEAQPFVADLLEGKRKFARSGPSPEIKRRDICKIIRALDAVEEYLLTGSSDELMTSTCLLPLPPSHEDFQWLMDEAKVIKTKNSSPREVAIEFVAERFNVTSRTLRKALSPDREKEYWR
ncbi:hypothetical protein M0220_06280 [Halomonas qinghailakensis]|uniref:Uncharacterized protein n=1 Tax=Halomonas qinghailakensis TaxID=2937790 RepID=A0AA46TSI6_9GAMM|nr:hypothetical protein [Halomonas sp. ZZQ-149]UYO75751.1 hypothetical protein M0220_06280 [Halomonas sp. ZZQ-149]